MVMCAKLIIMLTLSLMLRDKVTCVVFFVRASPVCGVMVGRMKYMVFGVVQNAGVGSETPLGYAKSCEI